jgi:hypothetical protein
MDEAMLTKENKCDNARNTRTGEMQSRLMQGAKK